MSSQDVKLLLKEFRFAVAKWTRAEVIALDPVELTPRDHKVLLHNAPGAYDALMDLDSSRLHVTWHYVESGDAY